MTQDPWGGGPEKLPWAILMPITTDRQELDSRSREVFLASNLSGQERLRRADHQGTGGGAEISLPTFLTFNRLSWMRDGRPESIAQWGSVVLNTVKHVQTSFVPFKVGRSLRRPLSLCRFHANLVLRWEALTRSQKTKRTCTSGLYRPFHAYFISLYLLLGSAIEQLFHVSGTSYPWILPLPHEEWDIPSRHLLPPLPFSPLSFLSI